MTFTVELTNNGPQPATGVSVIDSLPSGLTFVAAEAGQGGYSESVGTWTLGNLASGVSASLTLEAVVDPGTAGTVITNHARIGSLNQGDPNAANDTDSAAVSIALSDLRLTKVVDDPAPDVGDIVTYNLTLTNLGPDDATGIAVADTVPEGLAFQSSLASRGSYDSETGIWSLDNLASGDSATLALQGQVLADAAGHGIVNTASIVSADQTDPVGDNNEDSAALTVTDADLNLIQVVDQPAPNEGDNVLFTVTLTNDGPDEATGIVVLDSLDAGLTLLEATPEQGEFDTETGLWNVAYLAVGSSASLTLAAVVDSSTSGAVLTSTATITTADQGDSNPDDNGAAASVTVNSIDLSLTKVVGDPSPDPGDTVTFLLTLDNPSTTAGSGIEVTDRLPNGLTFVAATPSQGSYDQVTGVWSVGGLAGGTAATLSLLASVDHGHYGVVITNTAAITAANETDPDLDNNRDSAGITVRSADLQLTKTVDDETPEAGDEITYRLTLANAGPDSASGIIVTDLLPAQLIYAGATPSHGMYDPVSGRWTVAGLHAGATATLDLTVTVNVVALASTITNNAAIGRADQTDPVSNNNSDSVDITLVPPISGEITALVAPQADLEVWPRGDPSTVLELILINEASRPDTLTSLRLVNTASGPGSQAQLDADWKALELQIDSAARFIVGETEIEPGASQAVFEHGELTFNTPRLILAHGDTVTLTVTGQASLQARDGDVLAVAVERAEDLGLTLPVAATEWPLAGQAELTVDGFVTAQVDLRPITSEAFAVGSQRNLVLDVGLPPNGYTTDSLERLNVVNLGAASPDHDLAALEAWADDGDDSFDSGSDTRLGAFAFTGDRWELTGQAVDIPLTGRRFYVTADIAETASPLANAIRLGLPALPDVSVGMASGNDGPLDMALVNPSSQSISAVDQVILATEPIAPGTAFPGDQALAFLHLVATNTYSVDRVLTGLRVTNITTSHGASNQAELDGVLTQLRLRWDGDGDGVLGDLTSDPILGAAACIDGIAVFSGLTRQLPADDVRHLFLTADVSLTDAVDGDVIGLQINDAVDLTFSEATSVITSWPVDSGARWTVNAMAAIQIVNTPVPQVSLAAGDGPILALDLVVPSNGYLADNLVELDLENRGSATSDDLAELRLWRDGGDGSFDAGAGDDLDLGALVSIGDIWHTPTLDEPIPVGGIRLFTSVTVGLTPVDSATVQLGVPQHGITVASDADGPVDTAVESPTTLLLSTAPLLSTLEFSSAYSTVGQEVTVRMQVRNVGSEDIQGLQPSALTADSLGVISWLDGPSPGSLYLDGGATDTFTWTYRGEALGRVRLTGNAFGIGVVGGLLRSSLPSITSNHQVLEPVDQLNLFPTANMPFFINRGQLDMVPLSLTLVNPGGSDSADALLQRLQIRLEDEDGTGIVPAELLTRIALVEGTNVYLERTDLETSGCLVDLTLEHSVTITGDEPVTLGLRLDIAPDAMVTTFQISIESLDWFEAEDGVSGAPVPVVLQEGDLPIQSGLGRLVAEATGLQVSGLASADLSAGLGQQELPLLTLQIENPGLEELSSTVQVGSFTFGLVDSFGAAIADPSRFLSGLCVRGGLQSHAQRSLTAEDDSVITVFLSPPISAPVNTLLEVTLFGNVADSAEVGCFRAKLGASTEFDARDGNTGDPVPVSYVAPPVFGPSVTVEQPAEAMLVAGSGGLEPSVLVGAQDMAALFLRVRHPGEPGTSAIRFDTLQVDLRDQARHSLPPGDFVDRLAVLRQGVEIGATANPGGTSGQIVVPLSGLVLFAGQQVDLELRLDIEATAPASSLELIITADGLVAYDANLGSPVMVAADAGASFPLSSGLTQLQSPADELLVGLSNLLPVVLAGDETETPVAELTLQNTSPEGAGDIVVESLTLQAADRELMPLLAGDAVLAIAAYLDGELWAENETVAPGDTNLTLVPASSLYVAAASQETLELRVRFRPEPVVESLRLGLAADGVQVIQPGGAVLVIRIEAADGNVFPLWTEAGGFTALSLEASYSNFPNPFAAGRELTRFVFALSQEAAVDLRILTPHGEAVIRLLDGELRAAGLHQDDSWDGRNGNGIAVHNGVYVAELRVRYSDGAEKRLLRKVAVVR
ncbi:MAG: hypothetical protein ABIF77_04805 [bacterium]